LIDVIDNGIGVQPTEIDSIFIEGYRSVAARRLSNRGIGVGLNYSRETMLFLGGDLLCRPHEGGAHFQMKLKKAR